MRLQKQYLSANLRSLERIMITEIYPIADKINSARVEIDRFRDLITRFKYNSLNSHK